MNDIKLYYLRFLALLFCSILFYNSKSQNPFIENKGQLPANVNSKVVLPGGALFIEQDKFTYAFYNQEQLAELMLINGFSNVEYRNVSNGISAIHSGWKI